MFLVKGFMWLNSDIANFAYCLLCSPFNEEVSQCASDGTNWTKASILLYITYENMTMLEQSHMERLKRAELEQYYCWEKRLCYSFLSFVILRHDDKIESICAVHLDQEKRSCSILFCVHHWRGSWSSERVRFICQFVVLLMALAQPTVGGITALSSRTVSLAHIVFFVGHEKS